MRKLLTKHFRGMSRGDLDEKIEGTLEHFKEKYGIVSEIERNMQTNILKMYHKDNKLCKWEHVYNSPPLFYIEEVENALILFAHDMEDYANYKANK